MTGQQRAVRWLAAGVLVLWCGVFLRAENTEKSMVRALLLTPPTVVAQSWTVGLLYQFPEAAADASDAAAQVQLCTGQGNTCLLYTSTMPPMISWTLPSWSLRIVWSA